MEVFRALFEPHHANPGNDRKRWKHVWIKKATGMGITEFVIRLMVYLPLAYPDKFKNSQMAIVTGINMDVSTGIMQRMKYLLYENLGIKFDTNEREININNCVIKAYPSIRPDSIRSLPNPSFFFMDEFAFYPESLYSSVMDAVERYFAKSNPFIILNSTPDRPGDLLEQIEKQSNEECKYKRLFLLWEKGYGYIYSKEDIELARQSDSWAREYEGQYTGLKGNLFTKEVLDFAACFIKSSRYRRQANRSDKTINPKRTRRTIII